MSSASVLSFSALEYRDAGALALLGTPGGVLQDADAEPTVIGVPEDEVERRVAAARDRAVAEAEQRFRAEAEHQRDAAREQISAALHSFAQERNEYFARVECEVVQLALSISRKILQRESELDPTLLAGLVRIALDRMQSGPSVRVRVVPAEVEQWKALGGADGDEPRWEVIADAELSPGDCVVETELGKANFGFEAQLLGIEESFAQLIAHKPGRI